MAVDARALKEQVQGLDTLERPETRSRSMVARAWSGTWPKAAAAVLAVAIWQVVVWSGWKPEHSLPAPGPSSTPLSRGSPTG